MACVLHKPGAHRNSLLCSVTQLIP